MLSKELRQSILPKIETSTITETIQHTLHSTFQKWTSAEHTLPEESHATFPGSRLPLTSIGSAKSSASILTGFSLPKLRRFKRPHLPLVLPGETLKSASEDNSTFMDSGISVEDTGLDLNYLTGLQDKKETLYRMQADLQRQMDYILKERKDLQADFSKYLATAKNEEDAEHAALTALDCKPQEKASRGGPTSDCLGQGSWEQVNPDNIDSSLASYHKETIASIHRSLPIGISPGSNNESIDSESENSMSSNVTCAELELDLPLLSPSHPYQEIEPIVVEEIIKAYKAWTPDAYHHKLQSIGHITIDDFWKSKPSGFGGCDKTPPVTKDCLMESEASPKHLPQEARQSRKRRLDDDYDPQPPKTKNKRKMILQGEKRLACVFQKRYPLKHFRCGIRSDSPGFDTISHLKGHLRRCHFKPRHYCPRCQTVFPIEADKNQHLLQSINFDPCERRSPRDETALPRDGVLEDQLRARVDQNLSLEGQWYCVWDIVFPGIPRPPDCSIDDEIYLHALDYHEFEMTRGTEVIRRVVKEKNMPIASETDLEAFVLQVYNSAAPQIFQIWNECRADGQSKEGSQVPTTSEQGPDSIFTNSSNNSSMETPIPIVEFPQACLPPCGNSNSGLDILLDENVTNSMTGDSQELLPEDGIGTFDFEYLL
ncbi:hypothetical protein BGZ63DRAFT_426518 [Mariannaea sp. PMI_226]|nr:hypothetical protein BGZ63DRAFT_426518 [Mariannaea sp. PMI_226]